MHEDSPLLDARLVVLQLLSLQERLEEELPSLEAVGPGGDQPIKFFFA